MKIGMAGRLGFGAIVLAGVLYAVFHNSSEAMHSVTPQEAQRLIEQDSTLVVLDVRTPAEFAGSGGHLRNALLIPLQEMEARIAELKPYRDRSILVYCRTQNRSSRAVEMLTGRGFRALFITGGIVRWNEEQRPVILEQQP